MDQDLHALIAELNRTYEAARADGHIDDDEQAEIQALLDRVNARLGHEHRHADDGLVDHLEDAAIRFEVRHPTLSGAIRAAASTLSTAGM